MKKWIQLSARDKLLNLGAVLLVVAIIVYWQVGAGKGWFNVILMSSPEKVLNSFLNLCRTGSIWKHVSVSFQRVMIGFATGAGAGIAMGFLLAALPSVKKLLNVLLGLIRPIPSMALFPIFILWFGIGETFKIVVIAFVSFWPTFLNTEEGVRQADRKLLELARVLRKGKAEQIFTIILPSTLPYIFAGLRLAISRAWGGVVVAEMLAASSGIGFLIEYSRNMSQTATMFVGVIVIAIIGYILDLLLKAVQTRSCYWHSEV